MIFLIIALCALIVFNWGMWMRSRDMVLAYQKGRRELPKPIGYEVKVKFSTRPVTELKRVNYGRFGVSKFWEESLTKEKDCAIVTVAHQYLDNDLAVGTVDTDDPEFDDKLNTLIAKAEDRVSTLDAVAPVSKPSRDHYYSSYY